MKHLALLFFAASPALADPAITLTPMDRLERATTQEGVAFAPLAGDRMTEPYFAMVRLPAGTISPPHTKSATMFGLLLEGHMTHASPAVPNPSVIGPGAYYEIPANLPHVSACVSDAPCVTMLYQDGAFDFVLVEQ